MAQIAQTDESIEVEDLPQDVIDALPDEIRQEILDGVRDQIPEDVVAQLTPDIASQVPDSLVGAATGNPGVTAVIVVIALIAVAGAVWGAIKGFLKIAIGLGLLAAVAWYFIFAG